MVAVILFAILIYRGGGSEGVGQCCAQKDIEMPEKHHLLNQDIQSTQS